MTITVTAEPRECERCDGSGYIEVRVAGPVLTEKRCPGEEDLDDCDGGLVRDCPVTPGTVVSVDSTDHDTIEKCPAMTALANLQAVHALPAAERVYWTRAHTGRKVVAIAATVETAELWRAALGAPSFAREQLEHYSRFKTEHLWFGISVRLSYVDY